MAKRVGARKGLQGSWRSDGCYPVSSHLSKEDWSKVSGREAEASRQAGHWIRVSQVGAVPRPLLGAVDFSRVKQRLIF